MSLISVIMPLEQKNMDTCRLYSYTPQKCVQRLYSLSPTFIKFPFVNIACADICVNEMSKYYLHQGLCDRMPCRWSLLSPFTSPDRCGDFSFIVIECVVIEIDNNNKSFINIKLTIILSYCLVLLCFD